MEETDVDETKSRADTTLYADVAHAQVIGRTNCGRWEEKQICFTHRKREKQLFFGSILVRKILPVNYAEH